MNSTNSKIPSAPGIYIVRILSDKLMPVTRDRRYVDTCAKIDRRNVKVGKAKNLSVRQKNYCKDFDEENVLFIPLVITDDIQRAETAILRHLRDYRKRSPKGGLMDWLENIDMETAIEGVFVGLRNAGITFQDIYNQHN